MLASDCKKYRGGRGASAPRDLDYLTGLGLILLYIGLGLIKWINQAETPLENYEDFFELSVKQFVIQSSSISLGQVMCGVWKSKHFCCH